MLLVGKDTGIHSPTLDTSLGTYNQTVLTTTDEVNRKITTLEDSDEKHF
jgi:hypothetical protein